jgi:hypothetical protein
MTTPTLPAKLVAHLLAGVLEQARARAERLLDRNPRRRQAVHDRTAGRLSHLYRLGEQIARVYRLEEELAGQAKTVDAAVAGLLLAVAGGHGEAMRGLEDRLAELEDPRAQAVLEVRATEPERLAELILRGGS